MHEIKKLVMDYPDLRPIVLIIKKLLEMHNLNKPYHGGLNSYSLVLMSSTFLEEYGASSFSMSKNLSEFLNFFGNYFNPNKVGMDGK